MNKLGENRDNDITESSKVGVGVVCACIGAIVWVLSHILPTEARVEAHDARIQTLETKVDEVLKDTQYIRAKVDEMSKDQGDSN